jgi:uncharacterized protein DUF4406
MRKRVYISGPITKGDRNENFSQAAKAQIELMLAGYTTYNPMLSMANYASEDCDWETWLQCDEEWVAVSHLVLRLPGGSLGAERECDFARSRQIPVVGPYYFECLRHLFPDETETTYTREDQSNLLRFNRAERRAAGLPTRAESDPRLIPAIVEGFARVK